MATLILGLMTPERVFAQPFPGTEPAGRTGQLVEYFGMRGCSLCEKFERQVLAALEAEGTVSIAYFDVLDADAYEVLLAHLQRSGHTFEGVPVVVIGARVLQGDIRVRDVRAALAEKDGGKGNDVAGVETARVADIDLGFWAIILAGLADGVNPCAFTTIALLATSVAVGGTTRRRIMTIGLMFAVGVFATYSALGLGALGALRVLNRFELAGKVITGLSIAALIALSILSIRDAYLLQSGRMDRVVLQLPDPLKDRLRQRIRTQRRVGFVGAGAFTLGAAISMFEVVCTGQVYLPTLAYLAQRGNAEAVATLVIYNVAFIVPLLIVLAVVAAGAESNLISRLIKKHAALAKLAVTAAFMALAIVLLQELI